MLCYPGVWLRDGGRIPVQSSGADRTVWAVLPVGHRREGVSLQRSGLQDWSYSSQTVHPSSCLHPALPGSCSALGQLHHMGTHSSGPSSGGAHGAELRQRELAQSSLRMALDLPRLLVRQEELAGFSWHMTQLPLM